MPAPDTDAEKRVAAEAAAELVADGDTVGLGTGSTVAELLPALAARRLEIVCVATSPATQQRAADLGIEVRAFDQLARLDIAIDGADQIAPDGWLVKGGGGAHTREKIVANAADRFVVIADSSKPVEAISAPVPLELHRFGLVATLWELDTVAVREGAPPSPDDGVIADYTGEVGDPVLLAARLAATPRVVDHGLFAPAITSEVLIGRGDAVERLELRTG
ncbi:MAG: ribose 5-phosphate isomerase A [Actinomycetota bacterium]|nr:ribose 5-phosphate isomerase A [Actinomycetota bacterium]